MTEELKQAFDEGWRMAAEWANRDDLVPDMDSPQYAEERDDRLRTLTQRPAAQAGQGVHDPNAKLIELADRIDHEQLWRLSGLAQMDLPQEKQDRALAGVMLRRYANLLGNDGWRIFPPRPGASFRASTLDKVVEMARRDESRRASLPTQPAARATPESLTGCNCRWKGDTQVEWCEHHRAHLDAIHEWAQRAKSAEARLKATPEPVGEVPTIDLDLLAWERIKEAAAASKWIPPEYFQNDWVADVCEFLTEPHAHPAPGVPEGFDVQALTATGGGYKYPLIVVRDKSSQLGEDVFQDEHPVIYGLLSALLAAAQAKGADHA